MNIYFELTLKTIGVVGLLFACQYYVWAKIKKIFMNMNQIIAIEQEKELKYLIFSIVGTLVCVLSTLLTTFSITTSMPVQAQMSLNELALLYR